MAIGPGTRVGPYEVSALIGEGGMGRVWRAHHLGLKRDDALKVLPETFANDPERLARFRREAQVLASLNHPNIAHVYGLEAADGVQALVMELVEGPTLADRIAQGPIPLDEALPIARQIAQALEAAHDAGIVHRDLKPANIKLRPDATVKVLDFGLAKAMEPAAPPGALADSPTFTSPAMMTHAGVILGTAAYMSPEQARGKPVDKRTDVWAFGCVLYELLTWRTLFQRSTVSDTIAAILQSQPAWDALPASTPDRLRYLLQRCVQKDHSRRLRDIGDARLELEDVGEFDSPQPRASSVWSRRSTFLAWCIAGGASIVAIALSVYTYTVPHKADGTAPPMIRTAIPLPWDQSLAAPDRAHPLALSGDGRWMAYVVDENGSEQLYLRDLSTGQAKLVPDTAGAMYPFFSPDGQWVGFAAARTLQKVLVRGGAPLTICKLPANAVGASWGPDDTIVFAAMDAGLWKVHAAGGVAVPIPGSTPAAWPQILPDRHTVLFTNRPGGSALATISLTGNDRRILARTTDSPDEGPTLLGAAGIAQARYVASGYIVYGQSPGFVRAIPFDLATKRFTGSPRTVAESVERARNAGAVYFDVSANLLVYAPTGERHRLVWVTRQAAETPISEDRLAFRTPRVSPDGTRVVVCVNDERRNSHVWVYNTQRDTKTRVTTTGTGLAAVWTPDGKRLTFASGASIAEAVAEGGGAPEILKEPDGPARYPKHWSPDGRSLLLNVNDAQTGPDVLAFSRDTKEVRPILVRPFTDADARFSPDGKWIAYMSDESGQMQIYVVSYPELAGKAAISTAGGKHPVWGRNGRELFYRQGDAVMAVDVDLTHGLRAGRPRLLFKGAYTGTGRDASFDVSPDGQRFVMVKSDEASTLRQLEVVQNWVGAIADAATSPQR